MTTPLPQRGPLSPGADDARDVLVALLFGLSLLGVAATLWLRAS